jgi:glycosyltransferase involved in cell wall biosynthesis
MRVGISLLYLAPERIAGVATYTFGLIRALLERREYEYVLFVPRPLESMWRDWIGPSAATIVPCGPHPDRRVRRVLYEQFRLPTLARRLGVETVFFPHTIAPRWSTPRSVVTVHDLMALSKQTDFSPLKRLYIGWTYRQLARRVQRFVAVSDFTRGELHAKLDVPRERISVAPNALDDVFLHDPAAVHGVPVLPRQYVLSVGGTFPHKRLHTLVDAFRVLANLNRELHLVMCGTFTGTADGRAALEAHVEASSLAGRVHLLPRLDRSVFPTLYVGAECFATASEFEGFGIPLIEAMAMGCPVAASPAAGILETLGGHGVVASDFSIEALVEAMRRAMALRRTPGALERARDFVRSRYSWERAARVVEGTLAVTAAPVRVREPSRAAESVASGT